MKPLIKIALGGALATLSAGAFAQAPVFNDVTLTLFSTNDATPFSYAFNLGLTMSQLSMLPTTPGSTQSWTLTGLTSDLSGFTGTSNLVFDVTGATNTGSAVKVAGAQTLATTFDPSVSLATISAIQNGAITSATTANQTWLSTDFGSTNPSFTTSTTAGNYANANYNSALGTFAVNVASSVSNALPFYELLTAKGGTTTTGQTPTQFAGLFTVNLTTGVLTYTVPGSPPVPLPAGVWLLLSGLAGLGVLSRRRKGDAGDVGALPA